ncbi:Alpha/beta hydrolase fold-1 [Macrophomina phaseolina MS6]|uniref:Alpha/beta hydrolase fold-1 n=2 Tax=Macrophomina phaseolina TaxID=35725 RepID=K2SLU8_MACPH|nr:Alpha/beta hydrolase fold-1 [Macrophomina phaseolina MS6]KAH7064689.1 3-oxoadipate enol-lactone hydrolase [Macrophomina phaseolina]
MPFLTIGYKRLHYTDYAPASSDSASSSPPRSTLILHHGLGSSQNFYAPIVPALTQAGHRVITFDATGAGRSPYTQVEQSVATLAADVLAILDALSVPSAIVGGHSMGGLVAAHLAATASSARIAAAILIGPVYPSDAVSRLFEKRVETVERDGMDAMANSIPAAATAKRASPVARAFIRELLLAQDAAGYVSNCRVIANAARPDYEKISVPVLLLAGDEDKSAPLEMCKKQFGEIGSPDKALEVLPGVGHWHCIEAPEVVAEKILAFCKRIQ